MPDPLVAHAVCAGLVAADYLARGLRIQLLARGVGAGLTHGQAFAVNTVGDAACALTPLRLAGEPVRLAMLQRAGVPPTAALVAITLEVLAAWPVIIAAAAVLAILYAPSWWSQAAPELHATARESWPWLAATLLLLAFAWVMVRRLAPSAVSHLEKPARRIRGHWRQMPWPVLLLTVPLTLINLGSRVAILPVLAATLPDPPGLGPLLIGSFALLYSQLVLPTPSGAGAVEFGFLGGAAGDLGSGAGLLVAWRIYTTGIGTALGLAAGSGVLRSWWARRPGRNGKKPGEPAPGTAEERRL